MRIKNLQLLLIAFAAFSFQFLIFNVQAQASFLPAINFAVGGGPQSVTSSDFNADGKPDLMLTNGSSNNVSVLLGNGIGGFSAATFFTAGNAPNSIISNNFDGDDKADLAITNLYSNNVSVFHGNGMGGFSNLTQLAVGGSPCSITSTDFNGDGKTDLATANSGGNNVSILIGDGLGSFNTAINFMVGSPMSIISSDFNGDGKADLGTANEASNQVSVLLGDGTGGFTNATYFAVSGRPYSVISADFNGDGKADLATANYLSNKVAILLGNGAGGFSSPTEFEVGISPSSIIRADFNADGKVDLAVSNHTSNDVSILLGTGTGGFEASTNFVVGAIPSALTSGDFNTDGKVDLAVANFNDNTVSVLLNNFIPTGTPICLVTVDSTLTHNVVVWEKTNVDMATIDSFVVYREINTNDYQRIGAVSKDSLSTFDDLIANPASTAYRYKLKNKNLQGATSLFGDYHNTMYLTHAGADFSWTPYQIENNTTPVSAYKVYRDDNSTGNFQSIGSTTGNQFGFTDVNYDSYSNASYFVEAVMAEGPCNPMRSSFTTARSNVKYMGSINIYPNPTANTLNISGITGKTTLQLYDIVGKLLMKKEVENNATLSISQFEEGIYTLLSESKAGRAFNKVVISR